jgi:uncharacterized phage protein (TIGR02220 family)
MDTELWQQARYRNQLVVFLTVLLRASHKPYTHPSGDHVATGEAIISPTTLGAACGLSRMQVRRALAGLVQADRIELRPTSRHTRVRVLHWNEYQRTPEEDVYPTTNNNSASEVQEEEGRGRRKPPPPYEVIIETLNEKTGANHPVKGKKGEANRTLIRARWDQGYRVPDFQAVIEKKCEDWLGDDKMDEFLRPSTLFRKKNFGEYLAAAGRTKTQGDFWNRIGESDAPG